MFQLRCPHVVIKGVKPCSHVKERLLVTETARRNGFSFQERQRRLHAHSTSYRERQWLEDILPLRVRVSFREAALTSSAFSLEIIHCVSCMMGTCTDTSKTSGICRMPFTVDRETVLAYDEGPYGSGRMYRFCLSANHLAGVKAKLKHLHICRDLCLRRTFDK